MHATDTSFEAVLLAVSDHQDADRSESASSTDSAYSHDSTTCSLPVSSSHWLGNPTVSSIMIVDVDLKVCRQSYSARWPCIHQVCSDLPAESMHWLLALSPRNGPREPPGEGPLSPLGTRRAPPSFGGSPRSPRAPDILTHFLLDQMESALAATHRQDLPVQVC